MEQNQPFCLEAAWERLRKWALFLMNMLGAPAVLARLTVSAVAREEIVARLKPLEIGLRRALLIEALALRAPEAPTRRASTAHARPAVKSAKPSIAFRLMARPRTRKPSRPFAFRQRPAHVSAAPLAYRFEAALRVLNNRARYVTLLAARIQRARISLDVWRAPSRAARVLLAGFERAAELLVAHHNVRQADLRFASGGPAGDG